MFLRYHQEIPYAVRHLLEHYEFDQDGSLRIQWTLATERKSQKVGFQGLGKREVGGGEFDWLLREK